MPILDNLRISDTICFGRLILFTETSHFFKIDEEILQETLLIPQIVRSFIQIWHEKNFIPFFNFFIDPFSAFQMEKKVYFLTLFTKVFSTYQLKLN